MCVCGTLGVGGGETDKDRGQLLRNVLYSLSSLFPFLPNEDVILSWLSFPDGSFFAYTRREAIGVCGQIIPVFETIFI